MQKYTYKQNKTEQEARLSPWTAHIILVFRVNKLHAVGQFKMLHIE